MLKISPVTSINHIRVLHPKLFSLRGLHTGATRLRPQERFFLFYFPCCYCSCSSSPCLHEFCKLLVSNFSFLTPWSFSETLVSSVVNYLYVCFFIFLHTWTYFCLSYRCCFLLMTLIQFQYQCMDASPPRLWPLTDCNANCRPVLSSERAPKEQRKAIFRQKKGKSKIWSWAPKGCLTPRHTDWLTVSHKVTLTLTLVWST
jgi:hypothetical protein